MDSACQCGVNGNGRDAWLCIGVIGSRIQCAASIVKHRADVVFKLSFCALLKCSNNILRIYILAVAAILLIIIC